MTHGLRSEQEAAARMARELMDVKIEAAHLRERLRQRLGGDTTAAELEVEAFALQTALGELQETLKTRETALKTLESKYEKAIQGMMGLDEAWKRSREETRVVEQQREEQQRRGEELGRQLEAAAEREKWLEGRVEGLLKDKRELERRGEQVRDEVKARELLVCQVRAELATMKEQRETPQGRTWREFRHVQEQVQATREQAAAMRGEIQARQEEAAKVKGELRDTKAAEAATKQRLVQLMEDYATLRVHLESAKMVAVESTQRAMEAETEKDNLQKELEERDDVLAEKDQVVRALENELIQMQKKMEEALEKKKQAVEETQQRLMMESQQVLHAQEETWSCRETNLQQQVERYKQELNCMQALHHELVKLLQIKGGDDTIAEQPESVKPGMLKALVVQECNKRDILTSALERMRIQLKTTERQLVSQKQLETENVKLRAEYEKAKLAMERMATRKAKSFASLTLLPARPGDRNSGISSSSETSASKENRTGKGEITTRVKRELEVGAADTAAFRTTPRKAQRIKHVYVASRYLSRASKR